MRYINHIALLFISLLLFCSCTGQASTRITGAKPGDGGLASAGEVVTALDTAIFIIFQDSRGNYWFGSDGRGVYLYDGKTITHFFTQDGLPGNRLRAIQEDKQGNIFFNTLDGISKFDGSTFTKLQAVKSNEWRLHEDDLWFTTNQDENGVFRYDGKTLYHHEFPKHPMHDDFYKALPNAPYNPYQTYMVYKDSKGHVWFGTSTFGACRYDGKHLSWMYERHLSHIGDQGSFGIRSIAEDRDGKFWICNTRYRYSILESDSISNGTRFLRYKREPGVTDMKAPDGQDHIYFMSALEDSRNDLWMSTYRLGVWRYNGSKVIRYALKDGTEDIAVYAIYKDNRGDIWAGTHRKGVYKFNGQSFEKFTP